MVYEPRKLQKLGSSSLVVTLPREWIKQMGLKQGDKVYVAVEGDTLKIIPVKRGEENLPRIVLRADKIQQDKKKGLEMSPENLVARAVSCLYILGYDDIEIVHGNGDSIAILNDVKNAARRLTGLEVFETEARSLHVRYVADSSRVSLISTFRSMGLTVSFIAELIENMLKGRVDREEARESLKTRREDLFRYQHEVMRHLVTGTARSYGDRQGYSLMIGTSLLGLIGSILLDVANLLLDNRPKRGDVVLSAIKILGELVPATTSLLISPGLHRSAELLGKVEKGMREVKERMKNCKDVVETIMLAHVYQALKILMIILNTILCNGLVQSKYVEKPSA